MTPAEAFGILCLQQAGPQREPELPAGDTKADAQPHKPALGFGQGPETAAPGGEPQSLAEQARLRKAQQVRSSDLQSGATVVLSRCANRSAQHQEPLQGPLLQPSLHDF